MRTDNKYNEIYTNHIKNIEFYTKNVENLPVDDAENKLKKKRARIEYDFNIIIDKSILREADKQDHEQNTNIITIDQVQNQIDSQEPITTQIQQQTDVTNTI